MKHKPINISRFLIIVATALAGCYLGLARGRTADADSAKKAAAPMPALRGTTAIRHLEQTGFSAGTNGDTVVAGANGADNGGSSSGSAYVFAPTNQPPNCNSATPSISTIWPPNHKMINVTIEGVTDPDGDPVTINIDKIKQDEPTDGLGDGHTCPDGAGIGTSTAQLRAERSASLGGTGFTSELFRRTNNPVQWVGAIALRTPIRRTDHSGRRSRIEDRFMRNDAILDPPRKRSA
jgi:hypothetical protein